MNDLPERSPRHASGELGIAVLKTALPTQWIMREQPTSDYGIDVEIEIAGAHVTGLLLKGQVRSKTPILWRKDGTYREPFPSAKLAYWRMIRLPVILFLVDNESREVFWTPASATGPDSALPTEVIVAKSGRIPETIKELTDYVRTFVHREETKRLLYRLPSFLKALKECEERVGLDCFLALEPDEYATTQFVFEETLLLRQALRLSNADIIPWVLWLLRSNRIFGDSGELHNGVFDELIAYLRPTIAETVAAARLELQKEPITLDNLAAKKALEDHWFSVGLPSVAKFPREFWQAMESELEARGARLYRVGN